MCHASQFFFTRCRPGCRGTVASRPSCSFWAAANQSRGRWKEAEKGQPTVPGSEVRTSRFAAVKSSRSAAVDQAQSYKGQGQGGKIQCKGEGARTQSRCVHNFVAKVRRDKNRLHASQGRPASRSKRCGLWRLRQKQQEAVTIAAAATYFPCWSCQLLLTTQTAIRHIPEGFNPTPSNIRNNAVRLSQADVADSDPTVVEEQGSSNTPASQPQPTASVGRLS